jgi:hypothetical protein
VEPFRGVGRPRGMWRSILLGMVLAGVLAGCSLGGAAVSTRGGLPATRQYVVSGGHKVPLERWAASKVPEFLGGPSYGIVAVTHLNCKVVGRLRVSCQWQTPSGKQVSEIFAVRTSPRLALAPVSICKVKNPSGSPTSFECRYSGSPTQ